MNIRIYILISLIIIYYLLDNNFPPNKLLLSTPSRESFDKETFDIDTKSIAKNTKSIFLQYFFQKIGWNSKRWNSPVVGLIALSGTAIESP